MEEIGHCATYEFITSRRGISMAFVTIVVGHWILPLPPFRAGLATISRLSNSAHQRPYLYQCRSCPPCQPSSITQAVKLPHTPIPISARSIAILALLRYFMGLPFHERRENDQRFPSADAASESSDCARASCYLGGARAMR
jgi:hypothetical protein